jgi:hypothetical protein
MDIEVVIAKLPRRQPFYISPYYRAHFDSKYVKISKRNFLKRLKLTRMLFTTGIMNWHPRMLKKESLSDRKAEKKKKN